MHAVASSLVPGVGVRIGGSVSLKVTRQALAVAFAAWAAALLMALPGPPVVSALTPAPRALVFDQDGASDDVERRAPASEAAWRRGEHVDPERARGTSSCDVAITGAATVRPAPVMAPRRPLCVNQAPVGSDARVGAALAWRHRALPTRAGPVDA
jgi:hypothetical protein